MSEEIKNIVEKPDQAKEQMLGKQESHLEEPNEVAEQLMGDVASKIDAYTEGDQATQSALEKGSGLSSEEILKAAEKVELVNKLRENESKFKKLGRGAIISIMALMATTGAMGKTKEAYAAEQPKAKSVDYIPEVDKFSNKGITMQDVDAELERITRERPQEKIEESDEVEESVEEESTEEDSTADVAEEFVAALDDMNSKEQGQTIMTKEGSGFESFKESVRKVTGEKENPMEKLAKKINGLDKKYQEDALDKISEKTGIQRQYLEAALGIALSYIPDSSEKEAKRKPSIDNFDSQTGKGGIQFNIIDKKF